MNPVDPLPCSCCSPGSLVFRSHPTPTGPCTRSQPQRHFGGKGTLPRLARRRPEAPLERHRRRRFCYAAVRDGEVYVLDRTEDKTDNLRCISLADGKDLLTTLRGARQGRTQRLRAIHPPSTKIRPFRGGDGRLLCVDRKTHYARLADEFVTDPQREYSEPGRRAIPLAVQESLFHRAAQGRRMPGRSRTTASTANLVWKSPGLGLPGYISPTVVTRAASSTWVALGASNKGVTELLGSTVGISLTTADSLEIRWLAMLDSDSLRRPCLTTNCSLPGGYGAGSVIVQIKKSATGFDVAEVKKLTRDTQVFFLQLLPLPSFAASNPPAHCVQRSPLREQQLERKNERHELFRPGRHSQMENGRYRKARGSIAVHSSSRTTSSSP